MFLALSPNFARSSFAPASMAVTVTAMVPVLSPVTNGITARAPTLSFEPGAVTSPPAGTAGTSFEALVSLVLVAVLVVVSVAGVAEPVVPEPQADRSRPAVAAAAMNRGPRACVTAGLLGLRNLGAQDARPDAGTAVSVVHTTRPLR